MKMMCWIWLMLPVWAWLRNEPNARNTNKKRALPLSILHPLHVFLGTDRKMRAVQERWPELRDQGAGIENLGLGTENSVQSPDHCSMARCSCSCHCLPNDPRARSPDHPHDRCSRLALLCISMSVWSVRTKLLSTRLLCYKRSMAKWFRRKGKAPS